MAFSPGAGMTITRGGTAVGQVLDVTPHSPSVGVVETTHLESTWRARLPTVPDAGSLRFSIEYDASLAGHAGVTTAMFAKTVETWIVLYTDAGTATWSASGFVIGFDQRQTNIDNIVIVDVTVQLTGAITITP